MHSTEQIGFKSATVDPERTSFPPISNDDKSLLEVMLDSGKGALYDRLIGANKYRVWHPDERQRAQDGMLELFEAEMYGIKFRAPGIRGARRGIGRLLAAKDSEDPKPREDYQQILRSGRWLQYQNVDLRRWPEDLGRTGDFLHFGRQFRYEGEPDRLPETLRIYATPILDAVGHVGATVIREAWPKKLALQGKVWDESTNNDPISLRKDRLIFFCYLQRHIDTVMESLARIEAEQPELFEDDPPLLAEPTDIRGVGIAIDPADGRSFHESRVNVLQDAWHEVISRFVTLDEADLQKPRRNSDHIGTVKLHQHLRDNPTLQHEVIEFFRQAVAAHSHVA
jgi:hypothetical protein